MKLLDAAGRRLLEALSEAMRSGQPADFREQTWSERAGGRDIPAAIIRELVLRTEAPSGVQILGATIRGTLDLRNARSALGGAANTLKLEACELRPDDPMTEPGVDACHSHLSRLSLIGCWANGIHMSSSVVDGDVILRDLKPLDGTDECWIRARGTRIAGSLDASQSKLRIARVLDSWVQVADRASEETPFALNLERAQLSGALLLLDRFEAVGGVTVEASAIGSHVRLNEARLTASGLGDLGHVAFLARSAHLKGWLEMEGLQADGQLNLIGATIQGELWGRGARIKCSVNPRRAARDSEPDRFTEAIRAQRLDVRGLVTLANVQVRGSIDLAWAKIGGDLVIWGGTHRRARGQWAVTTTSLTSATIGGSCYVYAQDREVAGPPYAQALAAVPQRFRAPVAARERGVACYPGWRLTEILFRPTSRTAIVMSYLWDATAGAGGRCINLNGDSYPIHELNDLNGVSLNEATEVRSYVSLFCAYVWGDEGPFNVDPTSINVLPRTAEGAPWRVGATVQYGSAVYKAWFDVDGDGDISMSDDEPIQLWKQPRVRYKKPWQIYRVSAPLSSAEWPSDPYRDGDRWDTAVAGGRLKRWLVTRRTLDLSNADITGPSSVSGHSYRFVAYGARFGSSLELEGAGEVQLRNALIGSSLNITPGVGVASAVAFEHARIGDSLDLKIHGTLAAVAVSVGGSMTLTGRLGTSDLSGAEIGRDVELGRPRSSIGRTIRDPLHVFPLGIRPALSLAHAHIKGALRVNDLQAHAATVDLRDLRVGLLADRDGNAWFGDSATVATSQVRRITTWFRDRWGQTRGFVVWLLRGERQARRETAHLRLEHLRYDHLEEPRETTDRLASRLRWVRSSYTSDPPAHAEYFPQPFQQLARVWRSEGSYARADDITVEKLRLERRVAGARGGNVASRAAHRVFSVLKWLIVELPFGYGLRWKRAFAVFGVYWLVGALFLALYPSTLRVATSALGTIVTSGSTLVVEVRDPVRQQEEVPCVTSGGALLVDPVAYTFDVIVPFIELRQETQCDPSASRWQLNVPLLGTVQVIVILHSIYKFLGWAVVSGVLLTVSGIVRRQAEKD